jgi:hypothetical protein
MQSINEFKAISLTTSILTVFDQDKAILINYPKAAAISIRATIEVSIYVRTQVT